MYKYLIALVLISSSLTTQASNVINDERITEQKNCFISQFKAYDLWRGFMAWFYGREVEKKN